MEDYKDKIKELEEENAKLKEHLKKYTAPPSRKECHLDFDVYTTEDLKWHDPKGRHFKTLTVSDHWRMKMCHFQSSMV